MSVYMVAARNLHHGFHEFGIRPQEPQQTQNVLVYVIALIEVPRQGDHRRIRVYSRLLGPMWAYWGLWGWKGLL